MFWQVFYPTQAASTGRHEFEKLRRTFEPALPPRPASVLAFARGMEKRLVFAAWCWTAMIASFW